MKRHAYLDNLKLFLTLLVIFHHAGQAHYEGVYWPYQFSDPSMYMPWIWHFFSTNASFFMGLFFLIAGFFVPRSLDKQGPGRFAVKKLVHLGIPCVIMTVILSLLVGHFEIGHMWFVENLLFFSLLYALYRVIFRKKVEFDQQGPRLWALLLVALGMGLIVHLVRQHYPQDYWVNIAGILHFEPARYPQYVTMFILGLFASRFNFFELMDRRTGLTCLIAGALLAAGNCLRAAGPWNDFVTKWFGFYESAMSVSISFGLIWLFRECFDKTNGFLSWSCAQTYCVYIVHLPLMIALQRATDGLWMPPMLKFLSIGVLTTLISFALSALINKLLSLPKKAQK